MSEKRKAIITVAFLVVSALMTTGFVGLNSTARVVADGNVFVVENYFNANKDVNDIVSRAGVKMGPQDEYRVSKDGFWQGTIINVYRAVPVKINVAGATQDVLTAKQTVGELLASMGFEQGSVRTIVDNDARIFQGMEIKVIKVKKETVQRKDAIPFSTVNQPDATLERGNSSVMQEGQNGLKSVTVENVYEDGSLVASNVIGEKVEVQPLAQLVNVGTRDTVETSRGAMRFREVKEMEASAYLPTDGNGAGITATGMRAKHGVVAVDPDVIPLGTRLYIPNYGIAVAADTGGAIGGDRIDLCMESYADAMSFGRRSIKVYILE